MQIRGQRVVDQNLVVASSSLIGKLAECVQAQLEDLAIVTRDPAFRAYGVSIVPT
jgi:hypothetical protein